MPAGNKWARHLVAMRSDKTHRPLVLLVLAAAIPLLLFAGWVTYLNASQERTAARIAAFEALDRVATRVTSELSTQVEIAETLAASASLDEPDLLMFYREAKRLKDARPLWETIELVDTAGNQVLNLLRPVGAELGATADRENFEEVVRTGKAAIGGIGPFGPVSGRRLVALRAPVKRGDALKYVLTVALVPDAVSSILRDAGAPRGWVGTIVDAKGNIVARTIAEEFELGRPANASLREAIARASQGAYVGSSLEGVEVETIYRTLPQTSGWSVHLGIPTEMLNAPVTRSVVFLAGGGSVSLALAIVLVWLTARDMAQRRQDEEARAAIVLGVSEERRTMAVEAAELGTFSWELSRNEVLGSERSRDLLDLPSNSKQGADWRWTSETFLASIDPADRGRVEATFEHCVQADVSVDIEFRTVWQEGSIHWRRAIGRAPQIDPERPDLIHGVIADIGPRKQAEAGHLDVLRQLSAAQEREQRRIARELHDQIGQTVTGMSLGLKSLEQVLQNSACGDDMRERVQWLQSLASKIGQNIHQVASDLRPSALDDLGLHNALAALSSEWSEHFGLQIDLQILGKSARPPPEIEIAVYRVVQEALTNVLKHANARSVSLVLDCRPDQLRVIIEDDGVGFDPEAPSRVDGGNVSGYSNRRLGLSGIRERLALIGGTMTIESERGLGTSLFIVVPVAPSPAELEA
jgi:two-component system, NarL family, sensor histidine kinase UhpB